MTIYAALFSVLFLAVGIIGGWLAAEKYIAATLQRQALLFDEPHEFEELFQKNPHPELFDANGEIDRGDYVVIDFPLGFDPSRDGFDIIPDDEEW